MVVTQLIEQLILIQGYLGSNLFVDSLHINRNDKNNEKDYIPECPVFKKQGPLVSSLTGLELTKLKNVFSFK